MMSSFIQWIGRGALVPVLGVALFTCTLKAAAEEKAGVASLPPAAEAASPVPVAPTTAASDLPVLGPAPAWKTKALDGSVLGRDELKGKVVVVKFWATWCPPCVYEMPGYMKMQEKLRDQGLVVVGLSADQNMEMLNRFIARRGVNFPVGLLDQDIVDLFGETQVMLPTTYLIDREGFVRHRKVGAMEAEEYEKFVLPLL